MSVLDEFRRLPDSKPRLRSEERPAPAMKTYSISITDGRFLMRCSAGLRIDKRGTLISENPVWAFAHGFWLSVEEAQADDSPMNAVKEGL